MPRNILTAPPSRCLVMGIVNVTPDSFSGDGLGRESDIPQAAVDQARAMVAAGADILDIGGESTRPGAEPVSEADELARVVPVVAAIRAALPDIALSVDTYKARVMAAALDAGADIANDVWALRADPDMGPMLAKRDCPVILMHNRSKPGHAEIDRRLGGSYVAPDYGDDFLGRFLDEMRAIAAQAISSGIDASRIVLDPGVGFGKTPDQNMVLIDAIDVLRALGYPVLLAASRKSFMGKVLNLPADDRLETTLATTALAVQRGALGVRVHDVAENTKVVRMTEAVLSSGAAARRRYAAGNAKEEATK
ncbi:dihydropteroate synthase [Rhodospirillaceae bacterium KN72]|uniref:dihydropteroate synthase n=1 Tax=Pacificispira spongiicola TaxID=2729598 RepID=A0A7Y0E028_9PROT|nr:dihydropteroate synthase [Pacificispira spongiicola]NMM44643.1 dihydropteroate synthase [Pacificispira spongiicola]